MLALSIAFGSGIAPNGVGAAYAEATRQGPKLVVAQPVHDFGAVSEGTKVRHSFVLQNKGSGNLVVQRVVAACGCTAAAASPEPIAPGAQGTIEVEFDTSGFSGEKLKTVRLYTNDLDTPITVLSLKGSIEPEVVVEPRRVFFGDVVRGRMPARSEEVTIRVRPGSEARLTSVQSLSPHLIVEELESSPEVRRLRVTVQPEAPVGELRERIVIGVRGRREKSLNIPVFAAVQGTLQAVPGSVSFGLLEGQEMERSIKIQNRGETPIAVTEVRAEHPAVQTELRTIDPGLRYVVHIKLDPQKVKRDLRTSVTILTDSASEPPLRLNVYGIKPPNAG